VDKVKVTVVKKLDMLELFAGNLPAKPNPKMIKPQCDQFEVGQEFIMDLNCPPNFCGWAFADIQRDISHILLGGEYPWMDEKGVAISCCSDGFRPVIFKIERIKNSTPG
jgi:uncharacterized repeat protein (TIGR04076 family)